MVSARVGVDSAESVLSAEICRPVTILLRSSGMSAMVELSNPKEKALPAEDLGVIPSPGKAEASSELEDNTLPAESLLRTEVLGVVTGPDGMAGEWGCSNGESSASAINESELSRANETTLPPDP